MRPPRRCWREWLRRYAPPELLALLTAVAGYLALHAATANAEAAALGAAIGDNVGYYGMLLARDVAAGMREARAVGGRYGPRGAARTVRGLAVEFGPAEALDSALIRPACVYFATAAFGDAPGVLVGKVVADLVFYVPVITAYELRRRAATQ
jgi:hypothetical protein